MNASKTYYTSTVHITLYYWILSEKQVNVMNEANAPIITCVLLSLRLTSLTSPTPTVHHQFSLLVHLRFVESLSPYVWCFLMMSSSVLLTNNTAHPVLFMSYNPYGVRRMHGAYVPFVSYTFIRLFHSHLSLPLGSLELVHSLLYSRWLSNGEVNCKGTKPITTVYSLPLLHSYFSCSIEWTRGTERRMWRREQKVN